MNIKMLLIPILLLFSCLSHSLHAQELKPKGIAISTSTNALNAVVEEIMDGNAENLSAYFAEELEVRLMNEQNHYAKKQAQFVLRDFFNDFPPTAFSVLHQGQTDNTVYALGEYKSKAASFDVNVYLKKFGSRYLIERIWFEKK